MTKEIFTTLTNIKHNGMAWIVQDEYPTPVMNEFVKRLDSFTSYKDSDVVAGNGVRIIKSNRARTTLSTPFANGQRVIVKRYHSKGWREKVKYLLVPSRAKVEWGMMKALSERGISASVPLAYGERRRWGVLLDEGLIIKEIPDSLSFQAYIKRHCSGPLSKDKVLRKRVLLEKLANFIRHIHDKDIDHRDFHGGNILVTETGSGEPAFHLIDLHKARVCRGLSLRRRINDIALQCDIPGFTFSRTDCLRFIKYYKNFHDKKDFKGFASRVIKRVKVLKDKRLKSTTRWCLKLSNVFAVYKAKDVKIYYRKEYEPADVLGLSKRVTGQPRNSHHHVLKLSSKATVLLEEFPFKGIKKKVVVKHVFYSRVFFFSLRGLKFILIRIFLGTRGRRAWIAGNGFAVRGIPTPQPIALVERKFFGFTRDDILLTEYIDDSLSVNDYISKHFSNEYNPTESPLLKEGMGVKKKRLFIEELARLVRSFHDTGIYHSDLSGRNIIVREGQPGHWEMYIIDLDAVSLWKKLTLRRRLKDLARINNVCPDCITNTDRMRFFKAYFRGRSPRDHEYIERIFKLTEVIRCRRSRRRQRKRSRLIHRTRQVG